MFTIVTPLIPLTMLALIVFPHRAPAPIIYREGEGFSSGDLTDIEIKRNAEEQYQLGQRYEAAGELIKALRHRPKLPHLGRVVNLKGTRISFTGFLSRPRSDYIVNH